MICYKKPLFFAGTILLGSAFFAVPWVLCYCYTNLSELVKLEPAIVVGVLCSGLLASIISVIGYKFAYNYRANHTAIHEMNDKEIETILPLAEIPLNSLPSKEEFLKLIIGDAKIDAAIQKSIYEDFDAIKESIRVGEVAESKSIAFKAEINLAQHKRSLYVEEFSCVITQDTLIVSARCIECDIAKASNTLGKLSAILK